MTLTKGFYIVDENGELRTKTVRRKTGSGSLVAEEVPITSRTLNAAKDLQSAYGEGHAILFVPQETFHLKNGS